MIFRRGVFTCMAVVLGVYPGPDSLSASQQAPIAGMKFLQAGCFAMGSEEYAAEEPVHQVCLDDFYMGVREVSQKEFAEVMGYNPSFFKGELHPVETVTWPEAARYCRKKGRRLPTEAEWEFAARARSESPYPWGREMDPSRGWFKDNSDNTSHPVGRKKPNAFGLYDMSGNVWEWVADWYREDYYELSGQEDPVRNPPGPTTGQFLLVRGGSFRDDPFFLRAASRYWYEPVIKTRDLGFRCAANPPDPEPGTAP